MAFGAQSRGKSALEGLGAGDVRRFQVQDLPTESWEPRLVSHDWVQMTGSSCWLVVTGRSFNFPFSWK